MLKKLVSEKNWILLSDRGGESERAIEYKGLQFFFFFCINAGVLCSFLVQTNYDLFRMFTVIFFWGFGEGDVAHHAVAG
jgi:hypothetical protein